MATEQAKADAHRRRVGQDNERKKEQTKSSNTLPVFPPCEHPKEMEACRFDFLAFIQRYSTIACSLPMGEPHLEEISKIQDSVLNGGLFVIAMPRGEGKTTIALEGVKWIVLYGHLPYVVLIGATQDVARTNLMESLKSSLSNDALLAADFPNVVLPFQALENDGRKTGGQRRPSDGAKTGVTWEVDRIITADMGVGPTDEVVVIVKGLTSSFLGLRHTRHDGTVIRPSYTLVDDPQTIESAASPEQTRKRLKILNSSVLGLAGGNRAMSAVVACTKMAENCLSSQLLDRDKSARWRGRCFKMVETMPERMDLWIQYAEIRAECFRTDADQEAARSFYVGNREAMDAGAVLSWEHRIEDGDTSALMTAMNKWADDPDFFASEMQNEPLADRVESGALSAVGIMRQIGEYQRGFVPIEADGVVASVDCHGDLLYWMLTWYSRDTFTCGISDYGTWPNQKTRNFTRGRTATDMVSEAAKAGIAGEEGVLRYALTKLLPILRNATATRADGALMPVDHIGVDAGWKRDTVYQAILAEGGPNALGMFGRGIRVTQNPLVDPTIKRKRGVTRGIQWKSRRVRGEPMHIVFDANYWKSFLSSRIRTPLGADGAASLYDGNSSHHLLLCDHFTAERPKTASSETRTIEEWYELPARTENHWFDTFVNGLVLCSYAGAALVGGVQHKQMAAAVDQGPPPSQGPPQVNANQSPGFSRLR